MCETKRLILWLLLIVALLGLLILLLWLSLRPKQPSYTIVQFSLPTLGNGNTTSSVNQNGTVLFGIDIQNPNKDSTIYYDDMLLTFTCGEDTIGQTTIPSFNQEKDSTTQIIDHVNIDEQAWKKLVSAISNAKAELKVAVLTKIRYRMWGHMSKHHRINLHGKLSIGSDGKISGKKKKIKLHFKPKRSRR